MGKDLHTDPGFDRPGGNSPWVRFARWVVLSPMVWLVAIADLVGAMAGFVFWYGSTILESPWYYWIFVPDCPLAAAFMGIALLAYHLGHRWDVLGALAAATCIKYGLWTVVYWSIDFFRGSPASFESVTMSITHLLLLVQGILLLWFLRYRVLSVVVTALFLVGNDLADYVADQYPRLPETVGVNPMMAVAVGMTVAIIVLYTTMAWRRRNASTA